MSDARTAAFTAVQEAVLNKRGLSTDDALALGVIPVRVEAELPDGCPDYWTVRKSYLPGLLFPKLSPSGVKSWQLRPDNPPLDKDDRPKKYVAIEENQVSLNQLVYDETNETSIIVEGTIQSLMAAKYAPEKVNVYGLDGCFNFSSHGRFSEDLRALAGTETFVCYDGDAATNYAVYSAGERLSSAAKSFGASSVRFIWLPGGLEKDGLDDYLARLPADLRTHEIEALVQEARERGGQSAERPAARKPDPERDNTSDSETLRNYVLDHFTLARDNSNAVIARRTQGDSRIALPLETAVMQAATEVYGNGGRVVPKRVVKDVEGHFNGRVGLPHVTTALRSYHRADNTLVIDLGDDTGEVIFVDENGWRIGFNEDENLWFRRPSPQHTLPRPEREGSLDDLRDMFPVDDDEWLQILGWLIACPFSRFERPWLYISGPRGSAKTGTAKQALSIFDPVNELMPLADKDLEVSAYSRFIPGYDNASKLSQLQSDWFAVLVTGTEVSKRTLFTTNDETTMQLLRTGVITGIDLGGVRPDLAERLINIELRRDPSRQRSKETMALLRQEHGGKHLGAVLDAVSLAIRGLKGEAKHEGTATRFLDYVAVLAAYDSQAGTNLAETYASEAQRDREAESMSNPTVVALLAVVEECGGDTGKVTPATMLSKLADMVIRPTSLDDVKAAYVPNSPKGMSTLLKTEFAEPVDGVRYEDGKSNGKRFVRLCRPDAQAAPTPADQGQETSEPQRGPQEATGSSVTAQATSPGVPAPARQAASPTASSSTKSDEQATRPCWGCMTPVSAELTYAFCNECSTRYGY